MPERRLRIEGMHCAHCVRAVQEALNRVPGVEKAEVSLDPPQARIWGDADLRALQAAVEAEGYRAEIL